MSCEWGVGVLAELAGAASTGGALNNEARETNEYRFEKLAYAS